MANVGATRSELIVKCERFEKRIEEMSTEKENLRQSAESSKKTEEEIRKRFDDLKNRLHDSEMENQRLRGYIQRVQEDDTVREELVAVGDPNGEQNMVPKRKSTVFFPPEQTTDFLDGMGYNRDRPKPKHWVTY